MVNCVKTRYLSIQDIRVKYLISGWDVQIISTNPLYLRYQNLTAFPRKNNNVYLFILC